MTRTLADIDAMIQRERQLIAEMEADRFDLARRGQVTARVYWLEQLQAGIRKTVPKEPKRARPKVKAKPPARTAAVSFFPSRFEGDYSRQMEEVRREYERRVREREARLGG